MFALANSYSHIARGLHREQLEQRAHYDAPPKKAYKGGEYFSNARQGSSYEQTTAKVGLAPLKAGPDVSSEASVL